MTTLTIALPEAVEWQLAKRAEHEGKTVEALARELIEKAVAPEKTLNEILTPFRQSFAESGMTDQELDSLVEKARKEIWQDEHGVKP
jgi:plasmid stability protein